MGAEESFLDGHSEAVRASYRRLVEHPGTPREVVEFAQELLRLWTPAALSARLDVLGFSDLRPCPATPGSADGDEL